MSPFDQEPDKDIESAVMEVSSIVYEMAGIQLGPRQFPMVKNRLTTRMMRLNIKRFSDYLKHLKANRESESQILLSLLTTHHSYFFREFSHFEFLVNTGIHRLVEIARSRPDKTIKIWSAACSRGQEVYSLAMFFDYHLKSLAPDVKYEIWGTDVDAESVEFAKNGVFRHEEVTQSPAMYVQGYWIRGKNEIRDFTKVKSVLKSRCNFSVCNLLNPDPFLQGRKFDLVFCRNVFIYFSPDQVQKVSEKLFSHVDPNGYLFLGVSESLNRMNMKYDLVGPSVYQPQSPNRKVSTGVPAAVVPKVIEVLCIDDSPTIHALLDKILRPELGFKVKAKAMNGRQALDILKTQTFDVVTLDLHMPEVDGIGFLEQYTHKDTPVVVLSAVNRDDISIAQKAVALGATDYIQKPSLENLSQASNEIRAKLSSVVAEQRKGESASAKADKKIKVLVVDDSEPVRKLLKEILSRDPNFEVVGAADKPSQVESLIKKHQPDVITLDIHMPEMDGVTLLKKLMPVYHIPVVMISSLSSEDGPQVFRALEAGAVDYIQKPQMNNLREISTTICERLKIAASANLQWQKRISKRVMQFPPEVLHNHIVAIGASTGGTDALRILLEGMPAQIPPTLVVQHIPPVFSAAFASRLNEMFSFEVKEAAEGDELLPNRVLIAPGGKQMSIRAVDNKKYVRITDDAPVNRHKPSVDYFFRSIHKEKLENVIAILLTGMGADGAAEMKNLRLAGARTIAQDRYSSVVFGMPKEAINLGAAEFVLPITDIAQKIHQIALEKKKAA